MRILVILRMVPDVVEELEIAPDGKSLDAEATRMILSESDDHALEQALLLKERRGGEVIVLAPDMPDIDDALYGAFAKGVGQVIKIGSPAEGWSAREAAAAVGEVLDARKDLLPVHLILTGVQAVSDLDGLVAPLLAEQLHWPFVGIVTTVDVDAGATRAVVVKELPGAMRAEYEVDLPAVLGIQAAEKPPRYVPVAKVRAAMKTQKFDAAGEPVLPAIPRLEVVSLKKPELAGHAEMLEGDPDTVAAKLCDVLTARGLL